MTTTTWNYAAPESRDVTPDLVTPTTALTIPHQPPGTMSKEAVVVETQEIEGHVGSATIDQMCAVVARCPWDVGMLTGGS